MSAMVTVQGWGRAYASVELRLTAIDSHRHVFLLTLHL
jgi:hypothetical protein